MKIQIKNGVDNIFECLQDSITTVNFVKNLNYMHAENDDFFDTDTNTVMSEDEICKVYDLEIA